MHDLRSEYTFFEKFSVWFSRKLIVVFTVGKVGTLSVCASLEKSGFKHIHPHSLYFTWPGIYFLEVDKSRRERFVFRLRTCLKRIKVRLWKSIVPQIRIVSGVRDPFSRSISAYFEQVHYNGGIPSNWSYEDILVDFESRTDFFAQDKWFLNELSQFMDINIYDTPFDTAKGYCEFNNGKINALVYRIDMLSNMSGILSNYCGGELNVIKVNDSSDNEVGARYLDFKARYRYPVALAKSIMESKSFSYFYSQAERERFFDMYVER